MLVELAVGDAYGAGFEFRNPLYVRAFNRLDRHRRPALTIGAGGRYTDDTQMTIAVAEAMLSGEPWSPEKATPDCLAWQKDCESIISGATDGGTCSRFRRGLQ